MLSDTEQPATSSDLGTIQVGGTAEDLRSKPAVGGIKVEPRIRIKQEPKSPPGTVKRSRQRMMPETAASESEQRTPERISPPPAVKQEPVKTKQKASKRSSSESYENIPAKKR